MTASEKFTRNIENFEKALTQLKKALHEPVTPIVRDATIQRFEFTYELCWKTLKGYLEDTHGIRAVSPRLVFKEAFAIDLIENEDTFIEMIESRNTLSHTYNEEQAKNIYDRCSNYFNAMTSLLTQLKSSQ